MNKIKYLWIAFLSALLFTACVDDSADNPTFADDEMPIILMNWQASLAVQSGDTIVFNPVISPSEGATYKWVFGGETVSTEKNLAYKVEGSGEYTLYFEVDRNGVKNSRTATVLVTKPFDAKPYNKKSVAFLSVNGTIQDVQWDEITHLIVTSSQIKADGTPDFTFGGSTLDMATLIATAHNYGVYVLLEYSGALGSYINGTPVYDSFTFYNTARDPEKRGELISSMIDFVVENEFDGINIYMDKSTSGSFDDLDGLKAFYEELAAAVPEFSSVGKFHLALSVYGGWTRASLSGVVNIERYDWINVLAYAAEDLTPGAHSAFWYFESEAQQWENMGVAPERIVVAAPAFGLRYFGNIPDYTWGNLYLFTEYIGYRKLCADYPDAPGKNKIEVDNGIYYDGLADIEAKAAHVIEKDYAGMALWSIENDSRDADKSLIRKMNASLGN